MASESENTSASFTKLGPSVYLQDAAKLTDEAARPLILIAFWMNAPLRALTKYIVEYRRMIPSARIVFILSSSNDFFLRATTGAQQARVAPAVDAIRTYVTPDKPAFVHLFSNGGLSSTTHLLQAYRTATGAPLPISSMIMDSAPGTANVAMAVRAFSFALPRMWILRIVGKGFLWFSILLVRLFHIITRSSDPISRARKVINDVSLVQAVNLKGVPSCCYIYSDADDLVNWQDVERHALESESSGWTVRRERFQGTPHVGHMRADPNRYWAIVKEDLESAGSA
ncbi:uncharacterized protein N7459_004471 [Penicillium hispanicum]|uniref:uncharacterized protein n=1 Tax=Penicillium hispanicum TaxID=1080232 RepID=UPI002542534A|nr:uncharacterized protein N7459_004471 [Penicillium hispanicum]KAJ5584671.1 hypothetical protein N7459_004471 [Penicillium hispanicum]